VGRLVGGGPTLGAQAAELRRRAAELRACAQRGRTLATALGAVLEPVVTAAEAADLWQGPFAERSTDQLNAWGQQLAELGGDLTTSVAMWLREADRLEQEAGAIVTAAPAPSGGR
jgi:hypothetical protein